MKILSLNVKNVSTILNKIRVSQSKSTDVEAVVRGIIQQVKFGGDRALFSLNKSFDGQAYPLRVKREEINRAYEAESPDVIAALKNAKVNIQKFHTASLVKKERVVTTTKGVQVWREFRPIETVGLYVPGGKADYPSTALMLCVPALVAGCRDIILCVPPMRDGTVASTVLIAADLCGVSQIYKVGGAQAVAAMAYGTETIPKVSKIFGPGNQYVTTAKMLLYGEVDIDMPAGPSEVLVFADDTANPSWVAADLLSQLEHGEDSQAVLVCFSPTFARRVEREITKQARTLSRRSIITESLKRSSLVVAGGLECAMAFINAYAPEHLEIVLEDPQKVLDKVMNAGSVFIGPYTSEPLGDYATGANHTLPTSGYAKMFPALSVDSFGKKLQFQEVSKDGIAALQKTVEALAMREGLDAHARAVSIRFDQSNKP